MLKSQHRSYLILKARKPKWQDVIPIGSPELRESYKIAALHTKSFADAFLKLNREIIDDATAHVIMQIWKRGGSVIEVMNAIPFFNRGATDDTRLWKAFARKLQVAYEKTIVDAGTYSTELLNKAMNKKFVFSLSDKAPESMRTVDIKMPVVLVNPYSTKWMAERSLLLVEQGITEVQRTIVQNVLTKAFEKGLRAETVMNEIKDNIGLTDRYYKAVENRRDLLYKQGMPKEEIEVQVDKYRNQLLRSRAEMIARTETIDAEAHGRRAAWQMAENTGTLHPLERVWISAPASPNPDRPCEECLEMDGKHAPISGTYESLFYGAVDGPTLHPG